MRGFGRGMLAILALIMMSALLAQAPAPSQNATNPAPEQNSKRPSPAQTQPRMRVEVDIVLVNVTVTDPYNRLVTGLESAHFEVYEDREPQEILYFSSEDVPISLGVIFDVSGSMGSAGKLERARQAVVQFFKTANPSDESFVVTFSSDPHLLVDFTSSVEEIQNRLIYWRAGGRTAMLDGLYLGLSHMRQANNPRKALLLISDGGDNNSRYNIKDIKAHVREADVQIYAVGIFDPIGSRHDPELIWGPTLLSEIAEMTGGRMFPVELQNIDDLPDIASKISVELRNQYVIGYRPTNRKRDGTWRKIRVKLKPPKGLPPLSVYARSGYYAPLQ